MPKQNNDQMKTCVTIYDHSWPFLCWGNIYYLQFKKKDKITFYQVRGISTFESIYGNGMDVIQHCLLEK